MRDYQVQGLNWMISLHHNGINGILADEMVCPSPVEIPYFAADQDTGPRENPSDDIVPWIPEIPTRYRRTSSYRRTQVDPQQLGARGREMGARLPYDRFAGYQRGPSESLIRTNSSIGWTPLIQVL